jgi:FixJ family two-component response regulator
MHSLQPESSLTESLTRLVIAAVDDDERVLDSIGTLLESADYDVRLFACASALLESGSLAEVDCLISDIDLPQMDGFELARTVQAARPELPIILITGHTKLLSRTPPAGLGPYRLFKKPFDGQEVLSAISDLTRKPRL